MFGFLGLRLEREGFLVVEINAWREQRVGVQWWTLLSALRREVLSARPWYLRPFAWFWGLWDRIRAAWVPFAAAFLVLAVGLLLLGSIADLSLASLGLVAESLQKYISMAAAAFAGLMAITRFVLPGSAKSAQGFVAASDDPMQEVVRLFARTLRRAGRPVVFLIDDLDRCHEEYVVDFLEVMQTLVRDAPRLLQKPGRKSRPTTCAGPYAFVAADGRWIRSSYEIRYASFRQTAVPGRPLGYLFLEKIFQLQVRLPAVTRSAKDALPGLPPVPGERRQVSPGAQDGVYQAAKAAVAGAESEDEVLLAARQATGLEDPSKRMELLGDAAVKFSEPSIIERHGTRAYPVRQVPRSEPAQYEAVRQHLRRSPVASTARGGLRADRAARALGGG